MNVYKTRNRLRDSICRACLGALLSFGVILPVSAEFQPEIVGGNPAKKGAWPFMVAIIGAGSNPSDPAYGQFCGGVLIAPDQVLTAAHCVDQLSNTPSIFEVVVGAHDLSANDGVRAKVRSVVVHPSYDYYALAYDIAILKLATPLALPTVKLVSSVDESALLSGTEQGIVLGWGSIDPTFPIYPDILQQIELDIHSLEECKETFGRYFVEEQNVCAGNIEGISGEPGGSCYGDSGGPLLGVDAQGDYVLLGLVSWGFNCTYERFAGVYTRVSTFREWIASNPVSAPILISNPFIESESFEPRVGDTLVCNPGEWMGEEIEFIYEWYDATNFCDPEIDTWCDQYLVQTSGSPEFVIPESLVDRLVSCRVVGSNRRGSYSYFTYPVGPILPAEDVVIDSFPPFLVNTVTSCNKGKCTVDVSLEDESEIVRVEATRKVSRSCSAHSTRCAPKRAKRARTLTATPREDGTWRFTFKLPKDARRAVLLVSAEDIHGNRTLSPERVRIRP